MTPSVSVIIPVKDRSKLLLRALKSLQAQTFKDFEVVVVDDHSSEPLNHEILNFPLPHLRVLKSNGQGVSAARNTGILSGDSPYLAFLDSDDEWAPQKLEQQLNFLQKNPWIPLVHTEEIWIRNGVRVNPKKKHKKSGGRIFTSCTRLCLISPSASMMRRSLLENVGLFNETFPVCEDYELWLRVTARFEVGFLTHPLTIKYGGHKDQLSSRYHSMDLWRIRALSSYIHSPDLSESEKQAVCSEIQFKAHVLLKGFQKHSQFQFQEEVLDLLKKAETQREPKISTLSNSPKRAMNS